MTLPEVSLCSQRLSTDDLLLRTCINECKRRLEFLPTFWTLNPIEIHSRDLHWRKDPPRQGVSRDACTFPAIDFRDRGMSCSPQPAAQRTGTFRPKTVVLARGLAAR